MSGKSQWLPSKGDARVIKAVAPLHPAPPPPLLCPIRRGVQWARRGLRGSTTPAPHPVLTPRPHTAWSATPTLPHK